MWAPVADNSMMNERFYYSNTLSVTAMSRVCLLPRGLLLVHTCVCGEPFDAQFPLWQTMWGQYYLEYLVLDLLPALDATGLT